MRLHFQGVRSLQAAARNDDSSNSRSEEHAEAWLVEAHECTEGGGRAVLLKRRHLLERDANLVWLVG